MARGAAHGRSDIDVAARIEATVGRDVPPVSLADHYAAPEARRGGGQV